jgi:hypothetical protein
MGTKTRRQLPPDLERGRSRSRAWRKPGRRITAPVMPSPDPRLEADPLGYQHLDEGHLPSANDIRRVSL